MKKKTGLLYFQIKSLVTVTLILSFFRTCYGQTPLENKNKLILEESVGIVKNYQMEDTSWQVEETLDADEKTNREALYKIEAADTEYTPMIGALWQSDERIIERDGCLDVEAADTEYTPMVGALWQSDERIIERDGCLDVEAADTEYTPMVGALWQSDERIIERDGCLDVEAADTEYTPMVGALWQSDERIIERDGCLDVEAADTEYTPMIGALWQPDEQIVERDECMSTGGFPYYDKELYLEMDSKIPSSSQGARPQFLSKDIKSCAPSCFDLVASSGYVWKSDRYFKEVYGNGIEDIITLDSTWWISRHYGMGLKGSYWSANGRVIGIPEPTNVWQIPLVFSLKGRIGSTFQVYGSIGVDFIIVCESNFLGEANQRAWGGEVEGGINYFFYKQIYLNAACRYIYSRKFITAVQDTADFGGLDVRAGIGFSF